MIDSVYYLIVGAAAKLRGDGEAADESALSPEMVAFADHLAELLAAEFAAAMKEGADASSDLRPVLERESEGAEHRRSDPRVPRVRGA
jgi:hypothetical protein